MAAPFEQHFPEAPPLQSLDHDPAEAAAAGPPPADEIFSYGAPWSLDDRQRFQGVFAPQPYSELLDGMLEHEDPRRLGVYDAAEPDASAVQPELPTEHEEGTR